MTEERTELGLPLDPFAELMQRKYGDEENMQEVEEIVEEVVEETEEIVA